jgi:endonuclease III-like uncharacterized protein
MLNRVYIGIFISTLFASAMSISQVQTADKKVLGCIKGIGNSRLNSILTYRKEHNITEEKDLLSIKGIGKGILKNIQNDIKKKKCLIDKQKPLEHRENRRAIGAE